MSSSSSSSPPLAVLVEAAALAGFGLPMGPAWPLGPLAVGLGPLAAPVRPALLALARFAALVAVLFLILTLAFTLLPAMADPGASRSESAETPSSACAVVGGRRSFARPACLRVYRPAPSSALSGAAVVVVVVVRGAMWPPRGLQ